MRNLKPSRFLGAVALLTFFALSAAAQQVPGPEPSPPAEKPPMAKPESTPQTAPTPPKSSQSKSTHPLIGLTVISSDGTKIGDVRAVRATADGKVTALRVNSGGFLGIGSRIVEIPDGKFTHRGDTVRLSLTAEEVSKLPAVKGAT